MGDCNLGQCKNYKNEEKFCKYSYASWCPTCEKNSPRQRSRSETNEPCRRKIRDMKTLTPKKFNRREYENMEFEYDSAVWQDKDIRYDCCRIRTNLCELPTSYITNNHQISPNSANHIKITNDSSELIDCFKSVSYDNTLKFVDFSDQLENLGSMQDKSKFENKLSPNRLDNSKTWKKSDFKSTSFCGYPSKSPVRNVQDRISYLHKEWDKLGPRRIEIKNHSKSPESYRNNCREHCPLVDFKCHDLSNQKTVCYDTTTFFDRKTDTNVPDGYSEVEYLREKLKSLQNDTINGYISTEKNQNEFSESVVKKIDESSCIENVIVTSVEIKTKVKKEKVLISSPIVKSRNRVSLKTRARPSSSKIKKIKTKLTSSVASSNTVESDSGSDSEDETNLDDEVDNVSEISTDESNKDQSDVALLIAEDAGSGDSVNWPIRASLFPNIPPYIRFNTHSSETEYKVPNGKKFFKWKLSTITPVIVRKTLTNSGFALVRKSNQWLGTWGKHMKSPMFKTLKETQKLNHFPGTFQLGRKDRLWRNFQRMINKFGLKEFGFLPHSYILPQELKLLKQNWDFKNNDNKEMWIIKPPASARGVGIKVINKWSQLPKKTSLVVQRYVTNPYLINGSKFDLRLYVLVTSFNPLRIYLYPDGLARFASAKYSDDAKDLKDRYMHLTNYSINKLSNQYTANEDANACQGHKWTLSKLMEYLGQNGVDTKLLWKNLQQLVIKTIIACEPPITQLCEENMNNTYNCYELFGVDVLLDENLKPWLLEVNISPSLHSASPLDAYVKGPLVQMLFDMAQFNLPPRLSQAFRNAPQCFDGRYYVMSLTKKEKAKHASYIQYERREDYLQDILKDLTGDDIRHLTRAEDEFVVKGKFERIFPNSQSHKYLSFMEPRYYNRLFDAWESKYGGSREEGIAHLRNLCCLKLHLKTASQSTINKSSQNMIPSDTSIQPSKEGRSHPENTKEEIAEKKESTDSCSVTS